MAKQKWTENEVNTLVEGYDPAKNDESVEALMESLNRTKRQVIGKLVHMGVYVAPEKPKAQPKDEGPTKSEILADVAKLGFETEGFEGATKAALTRMRDFVAANTAVEEVEAA